MARKRARGDGSSPKRRRKRRSPEEIIADLQAEIRRVRLRAKARELKSSPAFKASLSAMRAIDKALKSARTEGDTGLRHALAAARRSIGGYLEEQGLKLPKSSDLPKSPRPKSDR